LAPHFLYHAVRSHGESTLAAYRFLFVLSYLFWTKWAAVPAVPMPCPDAAFSPFLFV
jgi:hypothetical protein